MEFFGAVIGKAGLPYIDKVHLIKTQEVHISIEIFEVADPFVNYTENELVVFFY